MPALVVLHCFASKAKIPLLTVLLSALTCLSWMAEQPRAPSCSTSSKRSYFRTSRPHAISVSYLKRVLEAPARETQLPVFLKGSWQ